MSLKDFFQRLDKFEFIKFAMVGASGAVLNIAVLYVLTEYFHVYYMISSVFSFAAAATSNYIWNKKWTFGESLRVSFLKKYRRFFAVSVIALSVNMVFLYIFTAIFGIYYILSQALAIGAAFLVNFSGNKIWVFPGERGNYSS